MGALNMVTLTVLGLLFMAQHSMQLSLRNPLEGVVQRINRNSESYIGLILTSDTNEDALLNSDLFVASTSAKIAGKTFNVGTLNGVPTIYVKSGSGPVNAAMAAQILCDTFTIEGLIHLGSAGAINNSLNIGDVVALGKVANTGSWKWLEYAAGEKKLSKERKLRFGDFNVPNAGDNYLASIEYESTQLYTTNGTSKTIFWIPANKNYLSAAKELDVDLEKCVSSSNCIATTPKLAVGLKGASADILVYNYNYRESLWYNFHVSTVDQESATTAAVAYSNGKPFIAIRGISNTAGGSSANSQYSSLAYVNANSVMAAFVKSLAATSNVGYDK